MIHYFIRSSEGIGHITQDPDFSVVENFRSQSLSGHLDDWHSPIYSVPDDTSVGDSPIAVVFMDGYDRLLYPNGSTGLME